MPDGDYLAFSETGNEVSYITGNPNALVFTPNSGGDDDFHYWAAEFKADAILFTVVPEPGLVGLQLVALTCLGGVARLRRRA